MSGLSSILRAGVIVMAIALTGCVAIPAGPRTSALPGSTKTFDQFRFDDGDCRQYASDSIGGQTHGRAQADTAVASTVAGAAIGAMIGAAVSGGHGAAVGAAVGGASGGLVGLGAGEAYAYDAQYRYDQAYQQCMYGKGHRVAVNGRAGYGYGYSAPPPPPRYGYAPPPPPPSRGLPPLPPHGSNVPPPGSAPGW